MDFSSRLNKFLTVHKFSDINIKELSAAILKDMELGLQENGKSQQLMAVMPFNVTSEVPEKTIIVIDAGGTNFRSCLVDFYDDGTVKISEEKKSSMIALDREFSKKEFFDALEEKISYLKNKASEIHFCFSYALKNLSDGDAQVIAFSKQVKAKEVVGSFIGKELQVTLEQNGWNTVKKIKVVNDTLACLLAGKSNSSRNFDSYIGFILGTGINNAYIEKNRIVKIKDDLAEHIVVCECGMYNSVPLSDFDISLDKESSNPGCSFLEKMCSGVYIGKISKFAVMAACKEGLFSADFSRKFENIADFSAYEISLFLQKSKDKDNVLGILCSGVQSEDKELLEVLLNKIVLRGAKIAASVIVATALKTCGKNVCITCNGSTFWKTKDFKEIVEDLLQKELTESYGIDFKLLKIENDITIGTALA